MTSSQSADEQRSARSESAMMTSAVMSSHSADDIIGRWLETSSSASIWIRSCEEKSKI
ncbi:hypothetical protein F511_16421 [Dorcoceras hygrometricum]|uniref:Uncharacterized protein n=1 Tax=Dorcoceras hygrometricum TaxID=472368 RepID=A0A2Z7AF67_9LAMI|nr:hypothetical protein F511_16421 [Dorcoceras hygrometricum]